MRLPLMSNISNARKMIKAHRGRSFMTMLGISIGIASVVTITSIGEGIKRQIAAQISHAGETILTVRPGTDHGAANGLKSLVTPRATGSLTDADISTVRESKEIATSAAVALVSGELKAEHGVYTAGPVVAAGDDLPKLLNQSIAYGAFFGEEDEDQPVAVLGDHAAAELFDGQVPLGQTFVFRGKQFMVRGIFNEFATTPLAADISYNDAVFIPYTTARKLAPGTQPYEILAKVKTATSVDAAAQDLNASLRKKHGGSQDFSVLKASDTLAATSSIISLLTELIVGAAAVSLFVGGIGIMNITLVAVTERLHEIGIRKAVGATNRQILNEFMSEAIVLSVGGAILGIVASLIINLLLRILTDIAPVVQWQVMAAATAVSVIIGILFGTVPALKAARKDPITALRGE